MTMRGSLGVCLLMGVLVAGCSDGSGAELVANESAAIKGGGEPANSTYPELITVSKRIGQFTSGICVGTLLGPTLAITSSHCNDPDLSEIVGPGFRGKANIIDRASFDTAEGAGGDLLLLRLDKLVDGDQPFNPGVYATIRSGATNQDKVTVVGRYSDDNATADAHMARGREIVVQPDNFMSPQISNAGDAGGPVYRDGTHELLGLVSVAGDCARFGKCDWFSRINDKYAGKIQAQAAAWGITLNVIHADGPVTNPAAHDPNAVVTVYQDCNFTGWSTELTLGQWRTFQLNNLGMPNDEISSIKVKSGFRAQLFGDDAFKGTQITLDHDESCLVNVKFNDFVSSLIVVVNPNGGAGGGGGGSAGGASIGGGDSGGSSGAPASGGADSATGGSDGSSGGSGGSSGVAGSAPMAGGGSVGVAGAAPIAAGAAGISAAAGASAVAGAAPVKAADGSTKGCQISLRKAGGSGVMLAYGVLLLMILMRRRSLVHSSK